MTLKHKPNQSLKLTEPAVSFSPRAKKFLGERRCLPRVYSTIDLAARRCSSWQLRSVRRLIFCSIETVHMKKSLIGILVILASCSTNNHQVYNPPILNLPTPESTVTSLWRADVWNETTQIDTADFVFYSSNRLQKERSKILSKLSKYSRLLTPMTKIQS